MKKIFFTFLLMALFFGFVQQTNAAKVNINEYTGDVAKGAYDTNVTDTTLSETIGKIIRYALSLVGVVFLCLTVYAGFLWMTAGGNEDNVATATKIFKASIIGLIIVLASYSITSFVVKMAKDVNNGTGATIGQ